jgi:peptidoglycan/LPS O-acetylase OafA/YrhL
MNSNNAVQASLSATLSKGLRHTPGSQTYIPGIDGLRAIAIAAVMLYHLNPSFLPGGFAGVDVFFVISGYVVSTSLSRDLRKSFGQYIIGFYARRIVRIVPALVVCLLVVSLLANLFIPESWLSSTSKDTALYAFLGLSNFALIWSSDGYFSPRVEFNPFVHTWSLAIEEQFYLVFPLLFYLWLIWRNKKNIYRNVGGGLVIVLLIASLAYSAKATISNPESAYYLLPSRFWELACGAWLFQLQSNGYATFSSRDASTGALLFGLLLIALAFIFSDSQSFPFPWAVLSVLGSALMIVGVSSPAASGALVSRFLDLPLIALVGKLSYSLYLWHWPVNVLFRWTVGLNNYANMILAVVATFFLAYLSFYFIENPIRRSQFIRSRPKVMIVLGGFALIAASWWLSSKSFEHQQNISLSVTRDKVVWYPWNEVLENKSLIGDPENCEVETKLRWQQGFHIVTFKGRNCSTAPISKQRLFVLGDSHAGAYRAMLRQLTAQQGVEVWLYWKGGCGVANMISPQLLKGDCETFVRASLHEIVKQAERGDVLFLSSLRLNRYGDQWTLFPDAKVKDTQVSALAVRDRTLALEEAKSMLAGLDGSGLKIIIDAPKPILRAPPFRCSDWFNMHNPICQPGLSISRAELLEYRKPIMESIAKLEAYRPDIYVWDPFAILCPTDTCSAFDENAKPLFFDGDHLSGHGNNVLSPSFQALLIQIWSSSVNH